MDRKILVIISIIVLSLAIRPLFSPYLIGTADGFAHKYRLVNFNKALGEKTIRPRWIGDAALGYGAPLFLFNYSIPYYIVAIISKLGFTIQTSAQIYAGITIGLSFISMYALGAFLWGPWAGIVAAVVYTFAPYHLFTTYSYEAWGEMLAFVFPPIILFLILKRERMVIVLWVLFILTHNISSYITSPILLLLGYVMGKKDRESGIFLGKIALLTVLLSAFFILPAITQTHTIKIPILLAREIAMRNQYMIPIMTQIRTSFEVLWGRQITYSEFTVGVPILIILFVGLSQIRRVNLLLLGFLIISLALVTPFSSVFYNIRPLQYVLYPYRFLFVATFMGSLLGGFLFRKSILLGTAMMICAVVFGYPFTHPYLELFPFPQSFFSKPQMLSHAVPTLKSMGITEFLPATADISFLQEEERKYLDFGILPKKFILAKNAGTVTNEHIQQESLSATITASEPTLLIVSTLYYPNWRARIDDKNALIDHDQHGRITIPIVPGTHQVKIHFGYSIIELASILISICGIILTRFIL